MRWPGTIVPVNTTTNNTLGNFCGFVAEISRAGSSQKTPFTFLILTLSFPSDSVCFVVTLSWPFHALLNLWCVYQLPFFGPTVARTSLLSHFFETQWSATKHRGLI